jgi:serine O-acetyltransferase
MVIRTRADLSYYLSTDKRSLNIARKRVPLLGEDIWKFQIFLRKAEYYHNSTSLPKPLRSALFAYYDYRRYRKGRTLGFTIAINSFGPGLSIAHRGTIVVNHKARIGENCRIHVDVNVGVRNFFDEQAPVIGNNVYIGPGAKIYGDITIADGVAVGANSVVNKSFLEPGITVAGAPAKRVSAHGSEQLLVKGTELVPRHQKSTSDATPIIKSPRA